MGIAGALIGSAVLGAGASVVSGNKSAGAISDASAATDATNRYIYDTTRADNAPSRAIGNAAMSKLAQMYGVSGGGVTGNATADSTNWASYVEGNPDVKAAWDNTVSKTGAFPDEAAFGQYHYTNNGQSEGRSLTPYTSGGTTTPATTEPYGGFTTSPGYQFRVDEATKAIERSAAARGSLRSGATMDALQRRVQGVASDEYEQYANHLAALAGVGQTANASNAAAGQAYGNQQTQTNMAAGQAQASSYQNTGNAINSGIQNVTGAYLYNKGYGGSGITTPSAGVVSGASNAMANNAAIF